MYNQKENLMHPLIKTIENLSCKAKETWEDEAFQERLEALKARLATEVRKNPGKAVAIALLAGFVLGKITTKKRVNETL